MAAGTSHDQWTINFTPVVALGSGFLCGAFSLSPAIIPLSAAGFLLGGLYLSPDLDTPSRPFYRWKMLRWYWLPYQKLLPHRSKWSHTPFVGTAGRLLYLFGPILLACSWAGVPLVVPVVVWQEVVAVIAGVVLSEVLHLFMDGLL